MSGRITKASEAQTRKAASGASKILRNPCATKTAKSMAGSALTQRNQVKKGGAAYISQSDKADSIIDTTRTVGSIWITANFIRRTNTWYSLQSVTRMFSYQRYRYTLIVRMLWKS